MIARSLFVALLAFGIGVAPARAQPVDAWALKPFHLSFEFRLRGMNAGTATMALTRAANDTWQYESRSRARGIFKLYSSSEILQASTLRVTNEGVQPLHFVGDDGSTATDKDVELRFDWQARRATGTAEDKQVDVAIEPGVQDGMSVQIALMQELGKGNSPTSFKLLDKTLVKDYEYSRIREESLDTAVGKLQTVVYRSKRPDSRYSTWYWVAPDYGYLPVKVERHKVDEVQWSLTVQTLQRD
ncbi:MAG: DUF3108 domain-containing protein [Steroidobacteraceae bacterium]